MYPILKPGTVVSIKQLQEYEESITGCFITKGMAELSKSTAEITEILLDSNNPLEMRYFIDLDDGSHSWAIDFFSLPLMIYQPGNKVKIQNLKQNAEKFSKPGVGLTSEMVNLSNKIATIVDAEYDDDIEEFIYNIDLDRTTYTWVAQYFYPPMILKRKSI